MLSYEISSLEILLALRPVCSETHMPHGRLSLQHTTMLHCTWNMESKVLTRLFQGWQESHCCWKSLAIWFRPVMRLNMSASQADAGSSVVTHEACVIIMDNLLYLQLVHFWTQYYHRTCAVLSCDDYVYEYLNRLLMCWSCNKGAPKELTSI